MPKLNNFQLHYLGSEQHLMLPTISAIRITQELYNVLFQYVVTAEKEERLEKFISMLETHIKSKVQAPFSRPLAELEFLDDGLQELRLLNWMEIPVSIFKLSLDIDSTDERYPEELEKVLDNLQNLMIFSRPDNDDLLWIYPFLLVR